MTSEDKKLKFDMSINLGTVIHLIMLLAAAFMVWHNINTAQLEFQSQLVQVQREVSRSGAINAATAQRMMRVETYLSAKDKDYWQRVGVPDPPTAATVVKP